jgi:hypothetical protein|eukprot:g8668.t1
MWGDSDEEEETGQGSTPRDTAGNAQEPAPESKTAVPKSENGDPPAEATEEEKNRAAEKIQAVQRGNAARQELTDKQEAAAKIQAVQRGNAVRKEKKEKDEAAAKIQAIQRGNQERAELKEKKEAAAKIQAIQRGNAVRKEMEENGGKPPAEKAPSPKKEMHPKYSVSPGARKKPKPPIRSDVTGPPPPTPDKYVYATTNRERTLDQSQHGQARIKQRELQAPSAELHKKSCLRRLRLPASIPSVPVILVIGDLASLQDEEQQKMLSFFSKGILRAAAGVGALVVDSGLASGPCAASPPEEYADYCRKVCTLGVSPANTEDPLSRYHTHQLILSDFDGWEKDQGNFVAHKIAFARRLAGRCRVACVLINNGYTSWAEMVEVSRLGFPTVIIENSGDLADEIATAVKNNQTPDLNLKEIISSSTCMVLDDGCQPADLAALLQLHLTMDLLSIRSQGPLSGRSK